MDEQQAIQVVETFLNRLGHTGASGFEGLVAILAQQATGQEFRLSSSGRQSGRDAASESGYANRVKIEAKHYGKTSALDLRELNAEIDEATESDPNLDIWILAASRPVSEQISESLDQHADSLGVEVVVLDLGVSGLPRLAVLMAAFPDHVLEWARRHQLQYDADDVRSALLTIARAADFESTKSRLITKLNGTVGYGTARRLVNNRLVGTLSDARNARSAFRQAVGIRAPGAQLIRRTELNRQIDEWWDAQGALPPAVALGKEGTGKTWAVFDWVLGRIDRGDMPIVLAFAAVAQELSSSDPVEGLMSRLLAKWTGVLDEGRWKRRLTSWLNGSTTGGPLILLIVDGLNERANVDWRPFFSTLSSDPWRDKIAVLATDRPHHWRPKCRRAGIDTFREIAVSGYSEGELDRALSASHLSHNDIPSGLMPLISIPRYCGLVAKHHKEMIAAADFTRERLIYLEIRDRQASRDQYPLTDEQFRSIIRDLAERARINPELRPKDLLPLISVPGGDVANIYEEIVGGGLLIPSSGMTESYRVDPLRLVFGFGMLLAEELASRSSSNSGGLEEFLTSWFEPQAHMDRKVDICGSAIFHALFQDSYPEVALRELIRYWLGLRNWADTAQLAFTAYVLRRPELFVSIAEEFWSSTDDSGGAQEFLGKAFVAHRDDPRLRPVLARAIERWMGFVHPLGTRYSMFDAVRNERLRKMMEERGGKRVLGFSDEAPKEALVRQGIAGRAGCPIVDGEIEVAGTKLTVISDGALLRLARFGLMVMSAGDPSPFVGSVVQWAVAAAVMDDPSFSDLVEWVIRLSDRNVDDALLEHARRLLSRTEAVASTAARFLLSVIGSRESKSLIKTHGLASEWHKQLSAQHAIDPCRSFLAWTESESLRCLARADVPLQMILERAALLIVDPTVTLPCGLIQRAREALQAINPAMIRATSGNTIEDHNLKTLTQLLCAHAPSELAELLRTVVRMMPDRDLTGQYFLAIQVGELALLLGACPKNTVRPI